MSENQMMDQLSAIESQPCPLSPLMIGIQRRADEIYAYKFCMAVVDLLLNFANIGSLYMSENQMMDQLSAIESQPCPLSPSLARVFTCSRLMRRRRARGRGGERAK